MRREASRGEVLVIDDEVQIRRLLRLTLEEAGYVVREAADGGVGLAELEKSPPDAVILDLGLPDLSGLEVLRRLRAWTPVPVLILSVFGQEDQKVAALDAGADDYLTKPFGDAELLARMRALLRRIKPAVATNVFRFGGVEVDFTHRRVLKGGELVKLTSMEFALLQLFITHRERCDAPAAIAGAMGEGAEAQTHYLRTFMLRLRKKLESDPDAPRFFVTESGVGYRFISHQSE